MSFRKEKKYPLTKSEMIKIKNDLFLLGMKELYPSRIINSCYFDTINFALHNDSEEGLLPRKKVRVRWYNDEKNFTKEIKLSSIEGRYKYLDNKESFLDEKELLNVKYFDKIYGEIIPTIVIKYEREYYGINNLRITFDAQITYKNIRSINEHIFQDTECVMEVKTPINCDDDYIEKIINHPTSRFSKYSRGINFINSSL